jgi:hypothetical protein
LDSYLGRALLKRKAKKLKVQRLKLKAERDNSLILFYFPESNRFVSISSISGFP